MRISVIIPTHNRPDTLRKTLHALGDQTLSREEFEVIVVDDGSDEATRRRIRQYAPPFEYRLFEKQQGGLASARNLGADHARGNILQFLDDDVEPAREALEQHLGAHDRETRPVAVVGSLPYAPGIELNAFLWYLERSGHYDLYKNPRKYAGGAPPMPPLNGNSSIPRELFFRVGKYDESFRRYGSEDLELGYRLAQAGVRFVYNPRAIGFHNHVKSFSDFCVDMETAGESLIRLYEKHPDIKAAKKIDVLEDRYRDLPLKKKVIKLIMSTSFAFPWILELPRRILRRLETVYAARHFAFPFYRWVGHYHYAVGMRRGLSVHHERP